MVVVLTQTTKLSHEIHFMVMGGTRFLEQQQV